MYRTLLCLTLAVLSLLGCGRHKVHGAPVTRGRRSSPPAPAPPVGSIETGVASWYGHPYHGRQAADGEIYDMETMVAAHRTLPFQTMVRVRNLRNDKTVDVRIIDRGPFVNNRIIDLSHAAARQVELIGTGTAQVEVTILATPPDPEPALFGIQVGAFRDRANATRMLEAMSLAYGAAKLVERPGDPGVWRVLAGRVTTPEAADELAGRIRAEQRVPEAFVVRLDP